ncbi:MAG: creatininase family protein [Planctomycetes bacterium]|nr:creatininase family protein [Planctomycetota bacterium]
MTWPEARAAFGPRAVAILPVGSTEPHGPHLPLDTDVTIAGAMARRAAELLDGAGVASFVLPPVPYGLTEYTRGFAGRVSIQPGTLWALIDDVIVALELQGVEHVLIVNGHLEPAHVDVLRGVLLDHAQRGPRQAHAILADVTRRKYAARLGAEFQSGDCHAGRYEASLVLAEDPSAVREPERARLPAVSIDLLAKMKQGVRTFQEAGAELGYCGDPAAASVEEGLALADELGRIAFDAAREAWPHLFGAGHAVS